jgi:hypothetical protein
MMQLRFIHTALFIALLASGCELVADFDRSKIPGNAPDSGVTIPPPGDDDDDDDSEDAGKPDASAAGGEDDAG